MEQNDRDQKLLQNVDKFNKKHYKFLKRNLQSVISVSLISLFLCYSSGFCFFPHSFIVFFSASLFSLFTQILQRRYIFLICNAILAILVKSLFSSSSSPISVNIDQIGGDFATSDAEEVQVGSIGSVDVALVAEGSGGEEEEEEDEDDEEKVLADQTEKLEVGQEDGSSSGAENEQREIQAFIADQDEGGGEEEEVTPEGNDELNRKFEEFIRKMKEEIRIEAQRQPIAV